MKNLKDMWATIFWAIVFVLTFLVQIALSFKETEFRYIGF